MASSIALRRLAASSATKLFNPVRSASVLPSSVLRSFNTNAQMTNYDDDDRSVDVDSRSDRSLSRSRDRYPGFGGSCYLCPCFSFYLVISLLILMFLICSPVFKSLLCLIFFF